MYSDIDWEFTTLHAMPHEYDRERPTEFRLKSPRTQRSSQGSDKQKSLLEGSRPDFSPACGIERLRIGPIGPLTSRDSRGEQPESRTSPSKGADAESLNIIRETPAPEAHRLGRDKSQIPSVDAKSQDQPSVPASKGRNSAIRNVHRGVACAPALSPISERSCETSYSSMASISISGKRSRAGHHALDQLEGDQQFKERVEASQALQFDRKEDDSEICGFS